jgi:hypothetical protein
MRRGRRELSHHLGARKRRSIQWLRVGGCWIRPGRQLDAPIAAGRPLALLVGETRHSVGQLIVDSDENVEASRRIDDEEAAESSNGFLASALSRPSWCSQERYHSLVFVTAKGMLMLVASCSSKECSRFRSHSCRLYPYPYCIFNPPQPHPRPTHSQQEQSTPTGTRNPMDTP